MSVVVYAPHLRLETDDEREERAAWDAFAAAAIEGYGTDDAPSVADDVLAARRKRFATDVEGRMRAIAAQAGVTLEDAMTMTVAEFLERVKR